MTEQVLEFSGHSNWVPFRPSQKYELVDYTLAVRVPPAYQVRSTGGRTIVGTENNVRGIRRAVPGSWLGRGAVGVRPQPRVRVG